MGVALLAAAQERGTSWPSGIDIWLLFWVLCTVLYYVRSWPGGRTAPGQASEPLSSGIWPPSLSTAWDGGSIATFCSPFPASFPGCG